VVDSRPFREIEPDQRESWLYDYVRSRVDEVYITDDAVRVRVEQAVAAYARSPLGALDMCEGKKDSTRLLISEL
jgi:hypothetical protein